MNFRALGLALAVALLAGCGRGKPPYEGKSVAELERMLDDPSPTVQAQGAFGLGRHGAEARPAAPALVRALKSPDALVRQQAAVALGQVGAEEAVPALAEALRDAEWSVRRQAAVALGQIGPPARSAEAGLRKCERDPNTVVRKAAREALGKIKGEAGR
jgi:HEAT repeat protein